MREETEATDVLAALVGYDAVIDAQIVGDDTEIMAMFLGPDFAQVHNPLESIPAGADEKQFGLETGIVQQQLTDVVQTLLTGDVVDVDDDQLVVEEERVDVAILEDSCGGEGPEVQDFEPPGFILIGDLTEFECGLPGFFPLDITVDLVRETSVVEGFDLRHCHPLLVDVAAAEEGELRSIESTEICF